MKTVILAIIVFTKTPIYSQDIFVKLKGQLDTSKAHTYSSLTLFKNHTYNYNKFTKSNSLLVINNFGNWVLEKDSLLLIETLPCFIIQEPLDTLIDKIKMTKPIKSLGNQKCTTVYLKNINGKYHFIRRFFEDLNCSLFEGQMTESFSEN